LGRVGKLPVHNLRQSYWGHSGIDLSKHGEAPLYLCRCVIWIMVDYEKL